MKTHEERMEENRKKDREWGLTLLATVFLTAGATASNFLESLLGLILTLAFFTCAAIFLRRR